MNPQFTIKYGDDVLIRKSSLMVGDCSLLRFKIRQNRKWIRALAYLILNLAEAA